MFANVARTADGRRGFAPGGRAARVTHALLVIAVSVVPPGEQQAVLKGVSFRLDQGQALGVIGPSGAGKSTLARAVCGVWRPAAGKIRLDGAALDQFDLELLEPGAPDPCPATGPDRP